MKCFRYAFAATMLALSMLGSNVSATQPQWWAERAVVSNSPSANTADENMKVANVGQLKYIAAKAAEELNDKLADNGGAGADVNALVASFAKFDAANAAENYKAANVGQLKYVSKKFYDRLNSLDSSRVNYPSGAISGTYPWASMPENPSDADYAENYKAALVGQLKYLFSWEVLAGVDELLNIDGIPDDWYNSLGMEYSEALAKVSPLIIEAVSPTYFSGDNGTIVARVRDLRGHLIKNAPVTFTFKTPSENSTMTVSHGITNIDGIISNTITTSLGGNIVTARIGNSECRFVFNTQNYNIDNLTSENYYFPGIDTDRIMTAHSPIRELEVGSLSQNIDPNQEVQIQTISRDTWADGGGRRKPMGRGSYLRPTV